MQRTAGKQRTAQGDLAELVRSKGRPGGSSRSGDATIMQLARNRPWSSCMMQQTDARQLPKAEEAGGGAVGGSMHTLGPWQTTGDSRWGLGRSESCEEEGGVADWCS